MRPEDHIIIDGIAGKVCTICKQWVAQDGYNRDVRRLDGLHSECRQCQYDRRRIARQIEKERHPYIMKSVHYWRGEIEGKVCTTCGQWQPLANYEADKRSWDGLRAVCFLCRKQANHEYGEKHKEECGARAKKWRAAHLEQARQMICRHYELHKDRYKQQARLWKAANRERARAIEGKRRARELSAAGSEYTTAELIKDRWAMFGDCCWVCGGRAMATDHVKPLAKGGAHWPCNLRPICTSCNSHKKDRWPYLRNDKEQDDPTRPTSTDALA